MVSRNRRHRRIHRHPKTAGLRRKTLLTEWNPLTTPDTTLCVLRLSQHWSRSILPPHETHHCVLESRYNIPPPPSISEERASIVKGLPIRWANLSRLSPHPSLRITFATALIKSVESSQPPIISIHITTHATSPQKTPRLGR